MLECLPNGHKVLGSNSCNHQTLDVATLKITEFPASQTCVKTKQNNRIRKRPGIKENKVEPA